VTKNQAGPARSGERERFWRGLVAAQARSGRSIREWCQRRGVSEPSFYSWRRELARRDARQRGRQVVPVELLPGPLGGSAALEIELPGPVKLRVPPGCDLAVVGQVLRLLRRDAGESEPC
jgi:transposase-like protein